MLRDNQPNDAHRLSSVVVETATRAVATQRQGASQETSHPEVRDAAA